MVNNTTPQIIHMIDKLMEQSWQMQNNASDAAEDGFGFSFEPDNVISAEPLDFYESAMLLQSQTADLYRLVCSLNRHSPLFVKVSSLMEKVVRHLGVFCITKAVLEQDGNDFRMLDKLNIGWLRSITAFNIRKCYAASIEDRKKDFFPADVMDLSFRWSVLDKRLIATEEKIGKIKAGTVTVSSEHRDSSVSVSSAEKAENAGAAAGETPALSEARAFPVDKAAVSLNRQKNEPEPAQRDELRVPDSFPAGEYSDGNKTSAGTANAGAMPSGRMDDALPSGLTGNVRPDDPDETAESSLSVADDAAPDGGNPEMRDVLHPENGFTAGLIPNLSDWVIRRFVEKHYPPSWLEKLTADRERSASPP